MVKTTPRRYVIRKAIQEKIPHPCVNCADRCVGCHSGCEKETEWKAKVDAEYQKAETTYSQERAAFRSNVEGAVKGKADHHSASKWNAYRK